MIDFVHEHVVTLKNYDDLEIFYQDMENEDGDLYIPNRRVEAAHKRPLSRNTNYMLTYPEAEHLRQDPRVEAVELTPDLLNYTPVAHGSYTQTSDAWDKSSSTSATMKNWGLLRCTLPFNISSPSPWGSNTPTASPTVSATASVPASGKNVDVVIVDSIAYPDHPEFDTRYVQYNWFQHNPEVTGGAVGTYLYDSYTGDNNHATHTSGTVAGNTQGWAREANIYNLRFSSSYTQVQYLIDYIRSFHRNKPINPETGRRNPTICNNSWGYSIQNWLSTYLAEITLVTYQGTNITAASLGNTPVSKGQSGFYTELNRRVVLQGNVNTGSRLVSNTSTGGVGSSIPFLLRGSAGLTSSTTPDVFDAVGGVNANDDGYWQLDLPFTVRYFTVDYTTIYVSTNGYITFGSGSYTIPTTIATPPLPKIMINAADLSCQKIYYGVDGADAETYTVTNSGASAYIINSSSNPTLTLERGGTYTFNVSALGHPFWIKTAQVTGTGSAYSTGVTNNGTDSGTITFTVPDDAPSTLYYICQFHESMVGTINVVAGTRTYTVRWEGTAASSGIVDSPNIVWEAKFYEEFTNRVDIQIGENAQYAATFTGAQLAEYGAVNATGLGMPVQVASLDADIADAIAEGILFVTSAGNDSYKIDVPGGDDYNNTVTLSGNLIYYHRGSSPGAAPGAICVGAIGTTGNEAKAAYSNTGPRVDIYAPGSGIISSVYDVGITSGSGNYIKYDGTSMAAPQVTGVLACLLEIYPRMTQDEALTWLLKYAGTNRIAEVIGTGFTYTNYTWIQSGNNKYLYFKAPRESAGPVFPNLAYKPRPTTGMVYPRPNIYRSL